MGENAEIPSGWESALADRYRLDGLLGSGSMAEVHRAEDTRLLRTVAIKLFRPDADPVAQQRFRDEARVLAQLSHPALVSIFDAGIDNAQPYLVMQLVEGESLRSRLLGGALPPGEAVRLGIRLATAIEHVHRCGIVHRDVKPSNILLDTEGNPYVADFGIALLAGAVRRTNAGQIVGTAAYLAPEQVLGKEIEPAVDVYALGLVLLECLTGELAYPGGEVESVLARLHRPPHIPSTVSPRLAELLAAMTAAEPALRPTAGQCVDALRMLDPPTPLADRPTMVPATAMPSGPTVRPQSFARQPQRSQARVWRRGPPYLAGAAVVAAVVVAGLVLMLGAREAPLSHSAGTDGANQPQSHTVPSEPAAANPATSVPPARPAIVVAATSVAPTPAPGGAQAVKAQPTHKARSKGGGNGDGTGGDKGGGGRNDGGNGRGNGGGGGGGNGGGNGGGH